MKPTVKPYNPETSILLDGMGTTKFDGDNAHEFLQKVSSLYDFVKATTGKDLVMTRFEFDLNEKPEYRIVHE